TATSRRTLRRPPPQPPPRAAANAPAVFVCGVSCRGVRGRDAVHAAPRGGFTPARQDMHHTSTAQPQRSNPFAKEAVDEAAVRRKLQRERSTRRSDATCVATAEVRGAIRALLAGDGELVDEHGAGADRAARV